MAPAERQRLPRGRRLSDRRVFRRLKAEGRRLVRGCLILNWSRVGEREERRLGVIAGRNVGEAVVRNRAKRLMREAYRQEQERVRPAVLVLIARPSIRRKGFASVRQDLLNALREAGLHG